MLVKGTVAFVAADPETISITPPAARVSDGAGGYTTTDGTPFAATVRLIPQSDKVPVVATWEGNREKVEYILIGHPDLRATIVKGSTFAWRGQEWRIAQLHDKPDYECKADVILHGG